MPQLTNGDPLEQLGKATAVVFIRVRERENREVGFTVTFREDLDESVDDGAAGVVVILGRLQVLDVHLDDEFGGNELALPGSRERGRKCQISAG